MITVTMTEAAAIKTIHCLSDSADNMRHAARKFADAGKRAEYLDALRFSREYSEMAERIRQALLSEGVQA